MSGPQKLRTDARQIWQAAVDAVDSERLIRDAVIRDGQNLTICGRSFDLSAIHRIVVVGAGKAGAGMAAGLEMAFGDDLLEKVTGWVNVPEDCVRSLSRIHLHAARPAGMNEPTEAGVEGSRKILSLVNDLGREDLCLILLSGGGSALLPAPVPEISLDDKQQITRLLMQSGASIEELNCVRKKLSQIKGGGLSRSIRAGAAMSLIISDVIGDPLEIIASGPTVPDTSTVEAAVVILEKYELAEAVPGVSRFFSSSTESTDNEDEAASPVENHVIGNNETAIAAAWNEAESLGYRVHSLGSAERGVAANVGCEFAEMCFSIRDTNSPLAPPACVLSGGEPVVHLVPTDQPRKGGRNQELILSALERLWNEPLDRMALLSGGTDGEDGPTDAAGAFLDEEIRQAAHRQKLNPAEFLAINNSYPFFESTGGLLQTGPTHTNVMDVRVGLVGAEDEASIPAD